MSAKEHTKNVLKTKIQFDQLFELIGELGWYQSVIVLICLFKAFLSVQGLVINYVKGEMEHWCNVPALENFTHAEQKHIAIPMENVGGVWTYSRCEMFDLPYVNYTQTELASWNRSHWTGQAVPTIPCDEWIFDRSVYTETLISAWELVCDKSLYGYHLTLAHMVGLLVGSLLAGIIADRFGRWWTYLVFSILNVASTFLCTYAPNFTVMFVGRFILGAGAMAQYLVSFVLTMEMVGPRFRVMCGVLLNVAYSFGMAALAGYAYLVRDYIDIQLALSIASVIGPVFAIILPESPRWLILKGRHSEADRVIRKIAASNKKELPVDFASVNDVKVEEPNKAYIRVVTSLFRYPAMRRRTILITMHWCTDTLIYYALVWNVDALSGNVFLNMFLHGMLEIPSLMLAKFAMDWKPLGRRLSSSLSLILAGLSSFACVPVLAISGQGMLTNLFAQCGKFFMTMAFACVYVYASELYPTEARNNGMGFSSMCSRVFGITAAYIGGPLDKIWLPLPSLVFGVVASCTGVLTLWLPETRGQPMPDSAEEVQRSARRGKNQVRPMANDIPGNAVVKA